MSYAEFQERQERAAEAELERLSRLPVDELIRMIGRGNFGVQDQAFAALAASREVGLAAPFLADQLSTLSAYPARISCAYALLSLLPYTGIPADALADQKHRGYIVYLSDLDLLLKKTLQRLEERTASP